MTAAWAQKQGAEHDGCRRVQMCADEAIRRGAMSRMREGDTADTRMARQQSEVMSLGDRGAWEK